MSKATTQAPSEPKQPAYVEELLNTGTVVLKAKSREELAEMVNTIPAEVRYGAGAVGRSREDGTYSLRIDLIVKPSES